MYICVCVCVYIYIYIYIYKYICIHSPATILGAPVQLLGNTNCKSVNHMAATQCILASRCGEDDLLAFKPSIRMGKKGDLSVFERGMIVGARRADLSISKTADLLGFSCTTSSRVYREWKRENIQWATVEWTKMPCWCQRSMGRLVRDDRKATITQITTRYNQGKQNTISERTTRRTLKQMGYSSRRPHRVLLLSAKNRKLRLQLTQVHQNWTIEDWKNVAWSDESRFLLRHSDGRVRFWCKEHESKDPSCLVSTVQAGGGGVMVWGIFSLHTLGLLVPIEHRLNATAYLSIVVDHVHPFMTTVFPVFWWLLPAG